MNIYKKETDEPVALSNKEWIEYLKAKSWDELHFMLKINEQEERYELCRLIQCEIDNRKNNGK